MFPLNIGVFIAVFIGGITIQPKSIMANITVSGKYCSSHQSDGLYLS